MSAIMDRPWQADLGRQRWAADGCGARRPSTFGSRHGRRSCVSLDSQRRQFDLVESARRRSIHQVEVVDGDPGRSASGRVIVV
jgi:hypothetical protein